jgi:VWFA-related protein
MSPARSRLAGFLSLVLLACAGPASALAGGTETPRVRILEPPPTRSVAGPTRYVVEVLPPAGRRIVEVRLFVDGHQVASLDRPPYETVFDAGSEFRAHTLRAEAVDDRGAVGATLGTTLYVSFFETIDVLGKRIPRHAILAGVVNRRGEPFLDIVQEEFELRVDGRREPLVEGGRDTRPLAVELLLDVSGSTIPYWHRIRRAADSFLSLLDEPDGSEISVFAGSSFRVAPFGHDQVAHRRAVLTFALAEPPQLQMIGSRLYDALALAIEAINVQPGQRSIAIFTDALDTGSNLSFEQVADVIHRANIRIDLIRFGRKPVGDYTSSTFLIRRMRRLAEDSGGRQWRIRRVEDIGPVFELLARQLKGRYRLVFAPETTVAGENRFHALKVKVSRKGGRVLAPAGFVDEAAGRESRD